MVLVSEEESMSEKAKIRNRLMSLDDLDDVEVEETDESSIIRVRHRRHYAADFDFVWIDGDHYVGYFVDSEGHRSQAVVSIWSALEAIKFAALYMSLDEIRAKREMR